MRACRGTRVGAFGVPNWACLFCHPGGTARARFPLCSGAISLWWPMFLRLRYQSLLLTSMWEKKKHAFESVNYLKLFRLFGHDRGFNRRSVMQFYWTNSSWYEGSLISEIWPRINTVHVSRGERSRSGAKWHISVNTRLQNEQSCFSICWNINRAQIILIYMGRLSDSFMSVILMSV